LSISKKPPIWVVVKTNPRAELKVNQRLLDLGYTTFYPMQTVLKVWSDRKKKVKQALIPSTLFVQTEAENINDIYPTQGVSSILKFLGKPAVVKDVEIENLKILLNSEEQASIETTERYTKGDLVKVCKGPFEGLTANILKHPTNFRLVIEIESLGSGFIINVPKSFIQTIKKPTHSVGIAAV